MLAADEVGTDTDEVDPEDDAELEDVVPPGDPSPEHAVTSAPTISRAPGPAMARDQERHQVPPD